ncbi:hypothetical protein HZP98_10075 [Elizabethkingia anophelis]|nr:hypothetical protein [Elizabethkingia anophelis]MCT3952378.1 hypothetical protein [Elizabethkingia anophelis]MCT3955921.1 hypothetical protein [Elizabethkingia anophelis]MCT3987611.1 hypothetical protein [Elizabethkingia anophelis]MCT4066149.1 hypothetical protein [Elizabethkingia anophelis]
MNNLIENIINIFKHPNKDLSHNEQQIIENDFFLEYRKSVGANKNKSQDDFEKYINLWSSGGIIISLMLASKLIEEKIDITYKLLFILGLIGFLITILSNLLSHNKSIKDSDFILENVTSYDKLFEIEFTEKIEKRNKFVTMLNDISIFSFIFGIICILSFIIINFMNMSNQEKPKQPQLPKPSTEEKGRTNPIPARVIVPNPQKK